MNIQFPIAFHQLHLSSETVADSTKTNREIGSISSSSPVPLFPLPTALLLYFYLNGNYDLRARQPTQSVSATQRHGKHSEVHLHSFESLLAIRSYPVLDSRSAQWQSETRCGMRQVDVVMDKGGVGRFRVPWQKLEKFLFRRGYRYRFISTYITGRTAGPGKIRR